MPPPPDPHRPRPEPRAALDLDRRSRDIFRRIVEAYLATGEPVGSRNLSRMIPMALSPASVRNVMADLETAGLLHAPHTSAGRLPTQAGLRFFVDALMQFGEPTAEERASVEAELRAGGAGESFEGVLARASGLLSGLSRGAGVVATSTSAARLKHVEFVPLDPGRALVVLVSDDGGVENRIVALPPGLPPSALVEAGNFLAARARGRTLTEMRADGEAARTAVERELDAVTGRLVEAGLAAWGGADGDRRLIVRGHANLLGDLRAAEDLERARLLFADLERQKDVVDLLARAEVGEGVRIFIGAENGLFSLSGSSLIAAPFRDARARILGVVGVIGPTRLDYARVVPLVDHTAKAVTAMLEGGR